LNTQTKDSVSGEGKRVLGFWTSSSLVAGNMIGSGIYLLPAALAVYGGISLFGWLLSTLGSICLALLFVNLSRMMPKVGGPYVYTREGFGDFPGFIVTWGYWISIVCANAAIAVALVSYLSLFIPVLDNSPIAAITAALVFIWLLTFVNVIGIKESGRLQLLTTILKIAPLVAITVFGIFYFDTSNFIPFNQSGEDSLSAIKATTALTLWAFLGLESATIPADNIKDPGRTIPKATVFGTVTTAIIYILSTAVVMGLISSENLIDSAAPFADAAQKLWGSGAGLIVAAGGVISCFGALNGWILLQGQVPYAAAKDRLFPAVFAKLSIKGTPAAGLIISSVVVTILMIMNYTKGLVEKFTFIILLATLATLVPYVFSALAEIFIFAKKREASDRKKFIKAMVIAILALIYSLWALLGIGLETILWGLALLVAGMPVFLYLKRELNKD
jgi:APA family basic amino acid/polyamine antiporter